MVLNERGNDAAGGPFNNSTITLSNGTSLTLRGTTQPTLDIRAGTTQFFNTPSAGVTPTRADIRIGSISNSGGLVYLTNQFQPNTDLSGNIRVGSINTTALTGGGSVAIDSRDRLVVTAIDVSGGNIGDPANPTDPADDDLQGNAGSIVIGNPDTILVRDGAQIAVNSAGTGRGGNIRIQGRSLALDNQALLTAETVSSAGGNINIQLGGVLALRGNSQISSTAGTANAGGDGGNITIDSPVVVATADENNDITANAFTGRGGRVTITTNGIFGLIPRSRLELETLLGTTDPTQLNPASLSTSDITVRRLTLT